MNYTIHELEKQLAASEKQAIKATAANINLKEQLASAQAELAEANATIEEQIKVRHAWELDNMALTGKFEAAQAEIAELKQHLKVEITFNNDSINKHLRLVAENLKLRAALSALNGNICGDYADEIIAEALSTPSDTTALTEYRNGVIEECAVLLDKMDSQYFDGYEFRHVLPEYCAEDLRAMKEKP